MQVEGPSQGTGAPRLEEAYHRGYTQGLSDALNSMANMIGALRNPPPILVDASTIDPKVLAALLARRAPEPLAKGSPDHLAPPSKLIPPEGR